MKFFGWHVRSPGQKAHCWVRMDDGDMVTLCRRRTLGAHRPDDEATRCSRCVRNYDLISVSLTIRRRAYEDVLSRYTNEEFDAMGDLVEVIWVNDPQSRRQLPDPTPEDVQRAEV